MSDRDGRGQFQRGNKGGPGRPPRVTETDYLLALSDAVTPDRWKRIISRAIEDAENGDDKARAWLASHLMPKPHTTALQGVADREDFLRRKEAGELTWHEQLNDAWA